MRKIIPFIIGVSFLLLSSPADAVSYKARCLNSIDKLVRCKVNLESESLTVKYSAEDDQGLNLTLPVNRITSISSESYGGRINFWTGQSLDYMGILIEHLNEQDQKKIIVIQFKPSEGFIFKTKLDSLIGSSEQQRPN